MQQARIGLYGLGTMGSALALNLADHGIDVVVSNRETDWIAPFLDRAGPLAERLTGAETLTALVAALDPPRVLMCMIPSGVPMDAVIAELLPLLSAGDILIDAGNADFNDTVRRSAALARDGLHYVGMGVSGGGAGARHGPSLMVGGDPAAWARIRPMMTAIAARYRGDPCVAHLGPDGAGHFTKTVHNGIEYADMQMIAEIYGLLRDGAGWPAPRIGALFDGWRAGPLASFLLDTTVTALAATDPGTGQPMADVIADRAGQKGTGRWTVIEAQKLGQAATTIEAAVAARVWSSDPEARATAQTLLSGPETGVAPDPQALASALLAGRVLSHAQGFELLRAASQAREWDLDLTRTAEIWRAGCIIRSALLNDFVEALRGDLPDGALVLAPGLTALLTAHVGGLRRTVAAALQAGLPVPALSAALTWYDSLRQARGPANLIQAQRDIFGHHGFERLDRPGRHHGPWA